MTAPSRTSVVTTKSAKRILIEGTLYGNMAFLPAIAALLASPEELTIRSIAAAVVSGLASACVALKSYMSSAHHDE